MAGSLFGFSNPVRPGSFPLQRKQMCTTHPAGQLHNSPPSRLRQSKRPGRTNSPHRLTNTPDQVRPRARRPWHNLYERIEGQTWFDLYVRVSGSKPCQGLTNTLSSGQGHWIPASVAQCVRENTRTDVVCCFCESWWRACS